MSDADSLFSASFLFLFLIVRWNWESRQTGKNSSALKDLARRTGTMWMPGELQYQQKLQREDPEAFKALLARNGIEYNPNYIRGSSH